MPSTLYNPDGTRTGLRINARSRRTKHMGGEPTSGLFTQPTKSEQKAISERARARRDAAAASTASAPAASAPAASAPAVKKPDGMLVPGRGGSSVWKTSAQLAQDQQNQNRAKARRLFEGSKTFVGPPRPRPAATFEGVRGIKGFAASRRAPI